MSGTPCARARRAVCHALLLGCAITANSQALAQPTPAAREEVRHLLDYLGKSGCSFHRNGEWHGAAKARQHLDRKYAYLVKKDLIRSAEDFIRLGATGSSASGEPYQVKCKEGLAVASSAWLGDELQRYRADKRAAR